MFSRTLLRPASLLRSCPISAGKPALSTAFTPCLRAISTSTTRPSPELASTTPSTSTPPPPQTIPSYQTPPPQPPLESLLPLLKSQPAHYITIHINAFPFLVTTGDTVTLPFLLKDVSVGDVLRLTHASILGSRDYTIKGDPWVNPELFELRARVVEVTAEPMRLKIKKKQRNRRTKTVKSKHSYTVLRIGELLLKDSPEGGAAIPEAAETS
ncbi:putative aconitate hydratase [Peziza echinospora]|nr:putative aconitate hydratase [Peziza echinospora]